LGDICVNVSEDVDDPGTEVASLRSPVPVEDVSKQIDSDVDSNKSGDPVSGVTVGTVLGIPLNPGGGPVISVGGNCNHDPTTQQQLQQQQQQEKEQQEVLHGCGNKIIDTVKEKGDGDYRQHPTVLADNTSSAAFFEEIIRERIAIMNEGVEDTDTNDCVHQSSFGIMSRAEVPPKWTTGTTDTTDLEVQNIGDVELDSDLWGVERIDVDVDVLDQRVGAIYVSPSNIGNIDNDDESIVRNE
jgi:hypothetical protein